MSIFVSIASYRDKLISQTIESLFSNSRKPHNIYVGIFLQIKDKSEDIDETIYRKYYKNLRVLKTDYRNAKGPLYARQLIIYNFYKNENYFLQIDSHTIFRKNWDIKMINELSLIGGDKGILTGYPVPFDKFETEKLVPHMTEATTYANIKEIKSFKAILLKPGIIPKETPYCGAGFIFGKGIMVKYYPMIEIPNLFQGEELLVCLALKHAGFKFYAPTENLLAHLYYRHEEPKIWSDKKDWSNKEKVALAQLVQIIKNKQYINK
jgi:hypothetical protein